MLEDKVEIHKQLENGYDIEEMGEDEYHEEDPKIISEESDEKFEEEDDMKIENESNG